MNYYKNLKSKTELEEEVAKARRAIRPEQAGPGVPKADPEVERQARVLAGDPLLFKKRLDLMNQAGVMGERTIMAMYFATLDSRLLPENTGSPNTLALKNSGHFGAGKSFTLAQCLEIYHPSCYYLITNGSPKCLYHLQTGLKHKALIVTEGFQFQKANAVDSELVYAVRSLLSEGRIRYLTVEKDPDGGHVTVEKILEGPTSFITTTVMEKLEAQLEDRLFTIHPNESVDQTREIILATARQSAGLCPGLPASTVAIWRKFHRNLQPVSVVVPFAPRLAENLNSRGTPPISLRRAFKRVLAVIQAVACAYQGQRQRDPQGRVIAEMADYYMALQMVEECFQESLGQLAEKHRARLDMIRAEGPVLFRTLVETWKVSKSAVSQWVRGRIHDGVIAWCDRNGGEFPDDASLTRAKKTGLAHIKALEPYLGQEAAGLPTPFQLTDDPEWDEGGRLHRRYDLELSFRPHPPKVDRPVQTVCSAQLNSGDDNHLFDIIDISGIKASPVQVLRPAGDETLWPTSGSGSGEEASVADLLKDIEF
ncbi:MAG: hypothetical protein FJ128_10725 [Deltaproteobacteria bacterium]|nr:hypothetical protein [Deltaproteobacteria bacterium]MBM4287870.1 hypothetical protein [Deltaproteobacteria bacterium]